MYVYVMHVITVKLIALDIHVHVYTCCIFTFMLNIINSSTYYPVFFSRRLAFSYCIRWYISLI